MKNTEKNYFTPGELAKLTGISKQILLYYDKNIMIKIIFSHPALLTIMAIVIIRYPNIFL